MNNPFWNPQQRRLRALWRLILQTVLFFFLTAVFSLITVPLVFSMGLVNNLDPAAPDFVQQTMMRMQSDPLFGVVAAGAAFLGYLLSIWLAGRFLDRRPFANFGFHFNRLWWADLGFGLFLGAFLMAAIFLIEWAAGWVAITGFFYSARGPFFITLLVGMWLFILVGVQEELLSRGYHLLNFAEGLNLPALSPRAALLLAYFLSSAIFGVMHALNPNASLISTLNIIIAGLFLGLGFVLTHELALPIGLHITWNFFQGRVFGFPVSGTPVSATVIAIEQGGPALWTGGRFGPEAGLIGLLAILAGSLMIVWWVRRTRGQARLQSELAEYPRPKIKTANPRA